MNLSKTFTLAELTRTSTEHDNAPNTEQVSTLKRLSVELLQPIRDKWGPLKISSGFRSEAVEKDINYDAYKKWCVRRSAIIDDASWRVYLAGKQHPKGEAADFIPLDADIDDVFRWTVRDSGLAFGQCIIERVQWKTWIHISLPREGKQNQMAMMYDGKGYKNYVA